jgi:NAD+ kinase
MRLGLVVHPRRDVEAALEAIRAWASTHGVALGQVAIPRHTRRVAEPIEIGSCDVVLALGGDGTALAGLHAAAAASRPVLGVACGSIGLLTSVPAGSVTAALDRLSAGDWTERPLPALEIAAGPALRFAVNDLAVVRDGAGQVLTEVKVDGETYARTAGDGLLVATPLGSSAYTMAAGGPILAPGVQGIVITPLAHHGGVSPPLVVGPESRVSLLVEPSHGGSRFEVDGQELEVDALEATIRLRQEYASLVALADQEPPLTALRRRGLVIDSPRILARDLRAEHLGAAPPPAKPG